MSYGNNFNNRYAHLSGANILRFQQFAIRQDFMNLIDRVLDNGERIEANLLARIALNTGYDSRQYHFDLSELSNLSGLIYPCVIEFVNNQRGFTHSHWEDGFDLDRLKFIARDDFVRA